MKKSIKSILLGFAMCFAFVLSGCKGGKGNVDVGDAPEFIAQKYTDFTEGQSTVFQVTNGYTNGDPFGVDWASDCVTYDKEGMHLSIYKGEEKYFGGEQKSIGADGKFKYGYFGCTMKPSNVTGTASTFFLYTGPSENNPHDEIDIEFLGKDTTVVQFNYFVDGSTGNEYWYDLGFDASEDYHQYGFYWDKDRIVWYVDMKPVYQVTGNVPSNYCRIFQNFWKGLDSNLSIMGWMGKVDDSELPAACYYKEVTYADLDGIGLEVPEPDKAPEHEKMNPITLHFEGKDPYTVNNAANDSSFDVTYTNVQQKSYKNVYVEEESLANYEYFSAKVKNNGEDKCLVRIDIAQAENVPGTNTKCCSTYAWMDGVKVKTDTKYGGSFFELPAGQESICTVKYYGLPYRVVFMLDSSSRTDKETFAGNIHVSDYRVSGEQNYEPPIEEPEEIDPSLYVLKTLTQSWTSSSAYTLNKTDAGMEITYSEVAGDSYENAICTFEDIEKSNGSVKVNVTNKGETAINLRADLFDLEGEVSCYGGTGNGGATYMSRSASTGGLYFQIAASSEGQLILNYEGTVSSLRMFIDSCGSDKKSHTNTLVVGEIKIEYQRIYEAEEKALNLSWTSGIEDSSLGSYTVTETENGAKVDYSVLADSYSYIKATNASTEAPDILENLQFKIKNENDRDIMLSLLLKEGNNVISNGGKVVEGEATFNKHSGNDGEKFTISAGATVVLQAAITIKPTLVAMEIDSLTGESGVTNKGSVLLIEEIANAPVNPDDGTNVTNPVAVNWFACGDGYNCEEVDNGYAITYKNVDDGSWYGGAEVHHLGEKITGGSYIELAVVNCNKHESRLSFRIKDANGALITVNSAENKLVYGEGSYYHYSSGNGPYFKVAPLSTAILHIPYSGQPEQIRMNIDSIFGNGGTMSGKFIIKGITSDGTLA